MDLLTPALIDLAALRGLDDAGWDCLVRQARSANLLGKLADQLASAQELERVPAAPRQHFLAALVLADRQEVAVRWEMERLLEAFAAPDIPLVLLKGSAYLATGLPAARGRLFSDIDLLVPRNRLEDTEVALLLHGWASTQVSRYDQRYYRQWMHELPPFEHRQRQSSLDVHHNILPLTARRPPDPNLLLENVVEVQGWPGVFVLQPIDMVLHSACHLFHEGELANGLRDLADLDSLLRHFGIDPGFWAEIVSRAQQLHLEEPLFYALQLSARILGTPVPAATIAESGQLADHGAARALIEAAYLRALRPDHPSADDKWTPAARALLYLRSHWLKMPPGLLIYHMARKGVLRLLNLDEGDLEVDKKPGA